MSEEPTGVHALPPWARRPYLAPRQHPDPHIAGLEALHGAIVAAPPEPDPTHTRMIDYLDRLAATFHPGGRFACPVSGCGWVLDVPPPELVDTPTLERGPDRYRSTWRYVGAPREQVEAYLVTHADHHAATTETGVDPYARGWHGAP
jgi:hypothetical protein